MWIPNLRSGSHGRETRRAASSRCFQKRRFLGARARALTRAARVRERAPSQTGASSLGGPSVASEPGRREVVLFSRVLEVEQRKPSMSPLQGFALHLTSHYSRSTRRDGNGDGDGGRNVVVVCGADAGEAGEIVAGGGVYESERGGDPRRVGCDKCLCSLGLLGSPRCPSSCGACSHPQGDVFDGAELWGDACGDCQ
ncbi:hypothetical protein KC19_10G147900 [Ceratodon purpureus]|uniref:Uncharacterized protein n=1 Tax=Ceratodon purpureus TaxID=3225 RepID=A0A8T0GKI1_CERPU|nr:hypothetical protein KC19_10G147900 [Ceratodon purpureus]